MSNRRTGIVYHEVSAKVTECYECGETRMCEILVSDPEPETGYVDEYALCEACKNGKPEGIGNG